MIIRAHLILSLVLFFLLGLTLNPQTSFAQSLRILKIQGKKAIVEISDPSKVRVNDIYSFDIDDSNSSDFSSQNSSTRTLNGSRKHALGFDLSFSYLKTDTTNNDNTSFTLAGIYLWNFKSFEVGPTLSYGNFNQSGSQTNTVSGGAQFFYNFSDNKPGVESIFSLAAIATIGSTTPNSGNSTTTLTAMTGLNYRWFGLSPNFCISISALYSYAKVSGNLNEANTSGAKILGGLTTYF